MKNWQHKLFVGLFCCAFLVFGWQNRVLAQGMSNQAIFKAELAQLEVTGNVYDYLLQYQPETYNLLTKTLAESIEDAKEPLADEVVNNL